MGLEEEEEDRQDLTSVIKVSKIKDNLKSDAELMLDTSKTSRWAPIRDIIHRRKLKRMGEWGVMMWCMTINKTFSLLLSTSLYVTSSPVS